MWKILVCQMCSQKFNGQIPGVHLKKHGLTTGEYQEKYGPTKDPDLLKKCQESGPLGGGYSDGHRHRKEERISHYLENPELCLECEEILSYEKRRDSFCNRSCSASYNNRLRSKPEEYMKDFRKYCWQSSFVFNFVDFPEEFDLNLLMEKGTYNPIKNPRGLSRDHMYSRKEGFVNKIDPKLLAHPANCEFMVQYGINGNSHKHAKCSITIEELYERINLWEEKYSTPNTAL